MLRIVSDEAGIEFIVKLLEELNSLWSFWKMTWRPFDQNESVFVSISIAPPDEARHIIDG